MPEETLIYIRLEKESADRWRPVRAERCGEGLYRILGSNPSPVKEPWPFETGEVVRCKPYDLTDSDVILVAYEKVR